LASRVDGQRALIDVRALADPALGGRQAGSAGNKAAAEHIAEAFAQLGLSPSGDDGTYYQWFDAHRVTLTASPELSLRTDDGAAVTLTHGVDFRTLVGARAGPGSAEGQVMYVRNLADESLHLGGRVVLTHGSDDVWRDARHASSRGAGTLLVMTDFWSAAMATRSNDQSTPAPAAIPVLELSRETSESLLDLAGYRVWELEAAPPALPLPLDARVVVQAEITESVSVPNVLGTLPGSDPELADQVIVVGAHLDHLGDLPDGTAYPGANNDASGVAALLEIARVWHQAGYRPRRTVLFAAWNGAELGQLGSEHYVRQPAYALSNTVAMIQMDMIGEGKGFYIIASGREEQDASILAALEVAAQQMEGRLSIERAQTGSDHQPFRVRGIPTVLLSWEEPRFANQPTDTPETIDLLKLQTVTRVTALTLMTMADD
jgi:hypothetical protein